MTPEELIKTKYRYYNPNYTNSDVALNGEQVEQLMTEYASIVSAEKDKKIAELRGDVLYWKRVAEMPEDDKWNVDRQMMEADLAAAKDRIAELEKVLKYRN